MTAETIEAIQFALRLSRESLKDWMQTTGFGEVYERDYRAWNAVETALALIDVEVNPCA